MLPRTSAILGANSRAAALEIAMEFRQLAFVFTQLKEVGLGLIQPDGCREH